MRISVAADCAEGVAETLAPALESRGHSVTVHGVLAADEPDDWAWCCATAAGDVAHGRADMAVVACWTGTGASIAANKVAGVRAALCTDPATAAGARRWNDANALALSLRLTSAPLLDEILDAWFDAEPSPDADDRSNIEHLSALESRQQVT